MIEFMYKDSFLAMLRLLHDLDLERADCGRCKRLILLRVEIIDTLRVVTNRTEGRRHTTNCVADKRSELDRVDIYPGAIAAFVSSISYRASFF